MAVTKIIVAEDESAVRKFLAATRTGAGNDVLEAANGSEAQQMVGDRDPSLILLDGMLRGMSGLEFAKRLKRDDRLSENPVIMLTARDEEKYKV